MDWWVEAEEREAIAKSAWLDAIASVDAMNLPREVSLPDCVSGLPARAQLDYDSACGSLWNAFDTKTPLVIAYAERIAWLYCWAQAHFNRRARDARRPSFVDFIGSSDGESYAAEFGLAQAAFRITSDDDYEIEFAELASTFGLEQPPSCEDVLLALYVFNLARGGTPGHDAAVRLAAMFESGSASALLARIVGWENGHAYRDDARETDHLPTLAIASARSALGRAGADARHAKMRRTRLAVIEKYKGERHKFSGKNEAAETYVKEFDAELFTIRGWLKGI